MVEIWGYKRLRRGRLPTIGLVLLGFALRILPIGHNRFHQDEALYAYFARLIAAQKDLFLQTPLLDKPPLNYYITGASIGLFWVDPQNAVLAEFIARLPHLFAAVISIALLWQISRQLFDASTAFLATLLFTLAPYAISFSTTLFAETLLTACLLAALWSGLSNRFGRLGLWLAAALALKPTALYFFPLVIGLVSLHGLAVPRPTNLKRNIRAGLLCFLTGVALLLGWQVFRPAAPPFWAAGVNAYNPQRLIRPDELWPRAQELTTLWNYLLGLRVPYIGSAIVLLGVSKSWYRRHQQQLAHTAILFIATFCAAYFAWHWLIAFNLRDRYFVPLVPFVCLLLAWGARQLIHWLAQPKQQLAFAAIILATLPMSYQATQSQLPVGGDHGAFDGVETIASHLRATPTGTVLYDLGLDWHWRFYLYESDVFIAWQPGPEKLAEDVAVHAATATQPRYVVLIDDQTQQELNAALNAVGYELTLHLAPNTRSGDATLKLFTITPLTNPF